MCPGRIRLLLLAVLLALVVPGAPLFAQEAPPWRKPDNVRLDAADLARIRAAKETVDAARKALADANPDAAAKALGVGSIPTDELKAWKDAADDRHAALAALETTVDEFVNGKTKEDIAPLQAAANRALAAARDENRQPPESSSASLADLRSRVDQAQQDLKAAQEALDGRREKLRQLEVEAGGFEQKAADLKKQIQDLEPETPNALASFRQETLKIRLRAIAERRAFAPVAKERWNALLAVRTAEVEAARIRLDTAQAVLGKAEKQEDLRDLDEADRLTALATTQEKLADASKDDHIAAFRARMQARIYRAQAGAHQDAITAREIERKVKEQKRINANLDESWDQLKARFGQDQGVSSRTPRLLLTTKRRVEQSRATLTRTLLPALEKYRSDYLTESGGVADQLFELSPSLDESPPAWLALLEEIPDSRRKEARDVYSKMTDGLRQALIDRQSSLGQVGGALKSLDTIYSERSATLDRIYDFVYQRIYWVRSDEPMGLRTVFGVKDEITRIAMTYTGAPLREGLYESYRRGTWRFVLDALAFLFLVVFGVWIIRRLRRYRRRWEYKGGPLLVAVQRILVTILFAGIAPAVLALAALLLGLLDVPMEITVPGQLLLYGIAIASFARRFLWNFFREDGIAVTEFKAPAAVAEQLSRASAWVPAGFVALVLPWWITTATPLTPQLKHIPRLFYTGMLGFYAFVLLSLLRRRGALMTSLTGQRGFWYRMLFFLEPMLLFGFLGIVAMDVLGYRLGAALLTRNVVQTFVWGLVLIGLYNLLTSAVQHASNRVRQRKRKEVSAKEAWERSKEVYSQLSRFAGVTMVVVAVVMLARFWGLADGLESFFGAVSIPRFPQVTLYDVLVALVWIGAGHFVIRHLPALYEVLLFPRLEGLDQGTRYVILTVSKYLVFLFAYASALLSLRFSFQSLGVVLAAVSVGIGFGLQEIVANFVSGLILFFERPVRVGDVVSVGNTVGTVERINIRATQVVNFERQVMIVPNRQFIVDQVTNWTHNDEIIRGAVEVGVAYGTDVERVGKLLMEIVKAHPKVHRDPEPRFLFLAFGDSSLNLRVWIYTAIADRLQAISEINLAISRRFAEEGIEIPFPQRDLHLKTVEDDTFLAAIQARGGHHPAPAQAGEADGREGADGGEGTGGDEAVDGDKAASGEGAGVGED